MESGERARDVRLEDQRERAAVTVRDLDVTLLDGGHRRRGACRRGAGKSRHEQCRCEDPTRAGHDLLLGASPRGRR
jgi:hypothetical protein